MHPGLSRKVGKFTTISDLSYQSIEDSEAKISVKKKGKYLRMKFYVVFYLLLFSYVI
jgi:hypothetical protein